MTGSGRQAGVTLVQATAVGAAKEVANVVGDKSGKANADDEDDDSPVAEEEKSDTSIKSRSGL